jgi:hypothetical protein
MTELSLSPSTALLGGIVFRCSNWMLGLAIALMALALAASLAVYFSESMKMPIAKRVLMALLRFLALSVMIMLLCKPVIVSQAPATKTLPIAILVDNTQSMRQRDPRNATEDLVRAGIAWDLLAPDHDMSIGANEESLVRGTIGNPMRAEVMMAAFQNQRLKLRDELRKKGPLQEFLFGQQLRGAGADWDKNLQANESKTALLYSINQLLQRDDNERPAAIVVATDGLDNDREHRVPWDDIGRECKRLEIPLHIYGVGGGANRMLQLRGLESNPHDTLLVDSAVGVTFRWACHGIEAGTIELNVKLNGRVVATKRVEVKEGDEIAEVLSFIPKKDDVSAGKVDLEGSLQLVGGAKEDQDRLTLPVRVVESKVKILYVEDSPRWEFKFLARYLLREKSAETSFVLINGDDKAARAGPPFLPAFPKDRKELFSYDLLIIGDVDPAIFTDAQRKWIGEFVEDGGGLVMIAGRKHNPSNYVGNSIGKLLPVDVAPVSFPIDDSRRPAEFRPQLSDIGRHETIMSLADIPDENLKAWANLPGWFWHYPVKGLKPGATSLLDHPKETIDVPTPLDRDKKQPMPLVARHYYGRGLVLFVASDETWRWRFNEEDKFFSRFWGQIVYQMGLPHLFGSKSQLIPEGDFARGKPTKVYARLFTPDYLPVDDPRVQATLERVDAKDAAPPEEVVFEPVKGQPGLYAATVTRDKPGDYNLKVGQGSNEGVSLPIRVIVPPDDELAPGNLNEKALRDLAERSGGKFYRENELKDLPGNVKSKTVNLNPPPRKEILLWSRVEILLLIVGLLTVEWLIRKFSNLS